MNSIIWKTVNGILYLDFWHIRKLEKSKTPLLEGNVELPFGEGITILPLSTGGLALLPLPIVTRLLCHY